MARIEISLSEYNSLKSRIKTLEENIIGISKEASGYKEKLDKVEALVGDMDGIGLFERIFNWKYFVEPLKKLFPENE